MRKPSYKRDANHNYLVFEHEFLDGNAYFQEKMILENQIEGLLPCSLHTFNGEKQYFYEISGRQTLACLFEKRQMGKKELKNLIEGISFTLKQLENFLLDIDCLLLAPEYIYYDLSAKQAVFCFLPSETETFSEKLKTLSEYLLSIIDHQENEAVVLAYQFYRLVKEDTVSFSKIAEELLCQDAKAQKEELRTATAESICSTVSGEKKEEETAQAVYPSEMEDAGQIFGQDEEDIWLEEKSIEKKQGISFYLAVGFILAGLLYGSYYYFFYFQKQKMVLQNFFAAKEFLLAGCMIILGVVLFSVSLFYYHMQRKKSVQKESHLQIYEEAVIPEISEEYEKDWECDFDETGEKTILLSENCYKEEKCLISVDRRRQLEIPLKYFPFIIGAMESAVDYSIKDKSVSRIHVKFTYDESSDTVYMQDLNSTNGTFHNGVRLETNERVAIYAEDEIQIGKRIFCYQ